MATNIAELLEQLGTIKLQANEYYIAYKELKTIEDTLKEDLKVMLKEAGLQSAKGDLYSVALQAKPHVEVLNERQVIRWLEANPDVDEDVYIGLKRTEFNTLASTLLKDTGELIDGTDIQTTEYLTVRQNKPEKAEVANA